MSNIRYKRLYLDFIEDTNKLPIEIKNLLKDKITTCSDESISFKQLDDIHAIIRTYISTKSKEERYQRLKTYDREHISYILLNQKNNNLTNVAASNHFKISRNTIAKWKNILFNEIEN